MRMLLIASVAALSACSAAATTPQLAGAPEAPVAASQLAPPEALPVVAASQVAAPRISCDVRTTRTAHGVRFDATARSNGPASGEYQLVITKRDRGGRSDIVQGGEYILDGGSQSLGNAEISLERGGGYDARLVLRDADGVACRAERSR